MEILLWCLGALIVAAVIYRMMPTVLVKGDSMYPNFRDGMRRRSVRVVFKSERYFRKHVGEVFLYMQPCGAVVMKRLIRIENGAYGTKYALWFEGDNGRVSYDSRAYGLISPKLVKFRIVGSGNYAV
jgi:signal peptidase I